MKIRPFAAGALLAAVAIVGSACGKDAAPDTPASSDAPATSETTAVDELTAALEKTGAEKTLKMAMDLGEVVRIEAEIDNAASNARMTTTTEAGGESNVIEMLVIGPNTYVQYVSGGLAEQMKGKWAKVTTASLGQDGLFNGEMFSAEPLSDEGVKVTKSGSDYTVVPSGDSKIGGLFGELGGGGEPAPDSSGGPTSVVFTVGADGLISGMKIVGATPDETATVTFSDYGAPVVVEEPDAKDVVEG
ncbi:hypothetical protein AB0I28_07600 [Phytomonospora sp. NPDC050363]|uniref:hypothetical protein n=1 Tax=Phytomonospora sp. NPDC050363 TaxID=3155642 RepID=UPI0033DEF30D